MHKLLLSLLSAVIFLCSESQAKVHRHTHRAPQDREQARLEQETMQACRPTGGEVCIMKRLINTGKVELETRHASRTLSAEEVQRVADILQQVRPNPHYVRHTGGHKRVGRHTRYSAPLLFLTLNGEQKKVDIYAITATGEERKRWQLEARLLDELHAIINRNSPATPDK